MRSIHRFFAEQTRRVSLVSECPDKALAGFVIATTFGAAGSETVSREAGGRHLADAAHGRDLLYVGIRLLAARRGARARERGTPHPAAASRSR